MPVIPGNDVKVWLICTRCFWIVKGLIGAARGPCPMCFKHLRGGILLVAPEPRLSRGKVAGDVLASDVWETVRRRLRL